MTDRRAQNDASPTGGVATIGWRGCSAIVICVTVPVRKPG